MRMRRKDWEAIQEWQDKFDGPGSHNKAGIFVDCKYCENRVFIHDTQEPPACPNCGGVFQFMLHHRREKRERRRANG